MLNVDTLAPAVAQPEQGGDQRAGRGPGEEADARLAHGKAACHPRDDPERDHRAARLHALSRPILHAAFHASREALTPAAPPKLVNAALRMAVRHFERQAALRAQRGQEKIRGNACSIMFMFRIARRLPTRTI